MSKFTKPTEEEIVWYLQTVKLMAPSHATAWAFHFWSFYESKNWMIGKNKMANWHIALGRALSQWEPPKQILSSMPSFSTNRP